jgi:hypothetical protein
MITTLTAAPGTVAISDDEMRRFAPSVFASQPIEGASERYSFLLTSSILNGMRENGWVPVRAQEQSVRTEARRGFQKYVVRFARGEHLPTWEKNQVRPEVVRKQSAFALTIKFISFSVAFAVSSFRRATLGPDDWLLSETDQNRGIGRPG